ncbi:MAG: tetratricopeptide repeat protein [Planctomycetota bacterium]
MRALALALSLGVALPGCDGAASPPAPLPAEPAEPAAMPKLDPALVKSFRLVKDGHYAEAAADVQAYLSAGGCAHPGQAEFLLGLGYHERQLYQSARAHFARALELEPDYFTTSFFYGFTLFNLGCLDEAKRQLEAFLARNPGEAEAVFGLGLVALEQDRIDDAGHDIERAIAMARSRSKTRDLPAALREDVARYEARLGDVHLRHDDLGKARAALERSVALWPEHFEPWHKLARVLERLGDHAGAERAQEQSDAALARRTSQGSPPR